MLKKMKYYIKLPGDAGIDVFVFGLPENFEDTVKKSFSEFTSGTKAEYRYCDKLAYIDAVVASIGGCQDDDDAVDKLVIGQMKHEWYENDTLITEEDIFNRAFMTYCYAEGRRSQRLYNKFGISSRRIYEQIQKVLVEVIKIVMNYGDT